MTEYYEESEDEARDIDGEDGESWESGITECGLKEKFERASCVLVRDKRVRVFE